MELFDIPEYNTPAYLVWVEKLIPELFARFLRQVLHHNWSSSLWRGLHKGEFAIVNQPHLDDDMQWLQTAGDAADRRIKYLINQGDYWPLWEEQNAVFIDDSKIPPHKRKPTRIAAEEINTPVFGI